MDSRYFSTDDLVSLLVVLVGGIVVGVLAGGVLLRLALRWIEGIHAGFLRCVGALLVGGALGTAANSALLTVLTLVAMAFGIAIHRGPGLGVGSMVASSVTGFVLSALGLALAVQWLVRHGDGTKVAFKRALAVAAAALGMWTVFNVACVAALLFALGGIPGVSR